MRSPRGTGALALSLDVLHGRMPSAGEMESQRTGARATVSSVCASGCWCSFSSRFFPLQPANFTPGPMFTKGNLHRTRCTALHSLQTTRADQPRAQAADNGVLDLP